MAIDKTSQSVPLAEQMGITKEMMETKKFPRLNVEKETENEVVVEFIGQKYRFIKSDEMTFTYATGLQVGGLVSSEVEPMFFLDSAVDPRFREVFMVHEIREYYYNSVDGSNSHEQALIDEKIYALQYLDENLVPEFLAYSEKYREDNKKEVDLDINLEVMDHEEQKQKMAKEQAERMKMVEKEIQKEVIRKKEWYRDVFDQLSSEGFEIEETEDGYTGQFTLQKGKSKIILYLESQLIKNQLRMRSYTSVDIGLKEFIDGEQVTEQANFELIGGGQIRRDLVSLGIDRSTYIEDEGSVSFVENNDDEPGKVFNQIKAIKDYLLKLS